MTTVNTDHDFNNIPEGAVNLRKLQENTLVVGIPWSDQRLNMIGLVQEYGTTIRPKNSQWLVIPTSNAQGRKPKDIPGLFQPKGLHNHVLAVADKSEPHGMRIMFILKKEVRIPRRPFLRDTWELNVGKWSELIGNLAFEVFMCRMKPAEFYQRLGDRVVDDIKRTIKEFDEPGNAALTVEKKGFNDPLIETGKMRDSISWFLERR